MKSHTELVVMSHFFDRQGDNNLQRNACGFFRSLMYQFLPYSYSSLDTATSKYDDMSDHPSWEQQWMREFLEKELPQACKFQPIVILVDAIDECSQEDRTCVMEFIGRLLSESPKGDLRICVSYSPGEVTEEANIDMALNNYEDIAKLVHNKLSALPKIKLSVSLESERSIPMDIQKRAQGMFLWAEIACNKVVQMDRHGKSAPAILLAIESLPEQLDDMFLDLLKAVHPEDAEESLRLFRWICFATKPLSVEQLQYAIMMDPEMKETSIKEIHENPKFRGDQRDMIRAILHLSRGLAKINSSLFWPNSVELIHDSVHDFLLSRGLRVLEGSTGSSYSIEEAEDATSNGHFYLSRSCVKYLSMKEHDLWTSKGGYYEFVSSFPLLVYAATSWTFHTEQAESAKKSQDDLLQILQWHLSDIFNAWVGFCDKYRLYKDFHSGLSIVNFPVPGVTLLHVLAGHGITSLLTLVLSSSKVDDNKEDSTCQTKFSLATDKNQNRAIKPSVEVGQVNFNQQDRNERTPLWYAAAADQTAAAKLLLTIGHANPNTEDWEGVSPLNQAARTGCGKTMEVFFRHSERDIKVTQEMLGTAASNELHGQEVMEFLLETKLPEVRLTPDLVGIAARNTESGPDVIRLLM